MTGIDLRRWPLFILLLPFIIGLALTRTDMIGSFSATIVLSGFAIILLLFRQRLPVLMLALGAVWGVSDLIWDASRMQVDKDWLAGDVVVSADVEQVEVFSGYHRYRLVNIRREDGTLLSGNALLYQHQASGKHVQFRDIPIQAGQTIRARVRWHEPRNYHNPGAFDYRAWCFDRHIALIGSLHGQVEIIRTSDSWLELQHRKVRSMIARAGMNDGGMLQAILLGERSQLSEQANRVFSATGAAHLLAISGMHIGMAAASVFALVWFLLTRREAWIIRLPARNIAMIAGFMAAIAYGSMAEWPLPAIRTSIMLAAAALAWCLAARSEPLNILLAALGLILLFDASAIASLSLRLSFIATTALLLWAGKEGREETLSFPMRIGIAGKAVV